MTLKCHKPNPVIELEQVNFDYQENNPVLREVNLHIHQGEAACIIGPNGGGKSTLLKLLLGYLKPASGTIKIFGGDPVVARKKIGFVPQHLQFDDAFPITVLEVARMGQLTPWGWHGKQAIRHTEEILDELGLLEMANFPFAALSGGQKQRVLIARALAVEPEILLFDEPTANADPGIQKQFYQLLGRLRGGRTMLVVSHDLGWVSSCFDYAVCVNGRVRVHPVSEITAGEVSGLFGFGVKKVDHARQQHCCCEDDLPTKTECGEIEQ